MTRTIALFTVLALSVAGAPLAAQPAVPLPAAPAAVAAPPPPAPAVNSDGSTRAVPLGNVGNWVMLEDLPSAAMAPTNTHSVRVRLSVSPLGFVDGCTVVNSSNDAVVDTAVCGALQRNAFFTPAHNAAGQGIAGEFIRNVRWAPPELPPIPATPVPAR